MGPPVERPHMDTARLLLGDPSARGDALAHAVGALVAFTLLVAIVGRVSTLLLAVGALLLLLLAAGGAYRDGGLVAALALAVLPAAGWLLGPLPTGYPVVLADVLLGLAVAVVVGVLGFALGVGVRTTVDA